MFLSSSCKHVGTTSVDMLLAGTQNFLNVMLICEYVIAIYNCDYINKVNYLSQGAILKIAGIYCLVVHL